MNATYDRELALAVRAAREAGRLIRNRITRHGATYTKSCPFDLVTEVDRQCELAIAAMIRESFPAHAVVGEEQQADRAGEPGGEMTWYVDPSGVCWKVKVSNVLSTTKMLPHLCPLFQAVSRWR